MKGNPMKKIATWLAAGVIVAAAALGCSVTVTEGDGGAGATGGTGGTGATGGTGGAAGTGGTAGTGGASGSSGAAGATGGTGGTVDAGSDAPVVMCTTNPNDHACNRCAFNKCLNFHCACNAVSTCRSPMLQFYTCAAMPNAKIEDCAVTFVVNANPDGSGAGLAADLAECTVDECTDTCAGREAGTSPRSAHAWKAALGLSQTR
jgi:hypothetical protein